MSDLCTACLCSGRNLYFIGETGFYHLYSQILNEIQIYDMSGICIRVCWECRALLRKMQLFKQQVKKSYTELLQYVQQNSITEPLPEPPHLQSQQVFNLSYPYIKSEQDPEEHDTVIVKMEDTHYEPESFVNNLDLEPKTIEMKVDKPAKLKVKDKQKKKKKINQKLVKKKGKIKRKRDVTPEMIQDNDIDDHHDDDNHIDDNDEKIVTDETETKVENSNVIPFEEETPRLNGGKRIKEILPDKPQCAECGKHFSSKKTYRYHLNVLHKGQNKYPCPRCGKVYQWKSNLGRHLRTHKARDSGELYCELCDKRFSSVATYRQHLRISKRHVPESEFSFQCNECDKKFVNKTRLRDHIDWEHLKKIKFRCQLCNKPFKCHTSLYVHMQNVHTNKEKKDNLCHVCGKSYQNAAKLKYHIVAMHTSETPYQCEQCSAAFGWYSSLYRHVREVHYKMKLQPKKSKKSKKPDVFPSLIPQPTFLGQLMHQPGPP